MDPVVLKGGPGVARSSPSTGRFRYGPLGLPIPRLGRRLPDRYLAVIMVAPALLLMLAYVLFPLGNIIYSAFTTQATLSSPHEWVGLGNFTGYLFRQDFFPTLGRSIYYTVANIVVQTVLGFVAAMVLHASLPGRNIARGMILFPFLVPIVVAALIWHFILDDLTGVANYVLITAHVIKQPLGWLSDPGDAMNAIVAISVWKYVPFMIILFLARLQTVPVELIEAAHVDGAGGLRTLWYIILPYMAPVVVVAVMLRTIFSFNEYEVPFLMTQGGPDNRTLVLPILIRQMLLTDLQTGPAAAVSLLMLLVLVACGLGYWYFYRLGEKAFE